MSQTALVLTSIAAALAILATVWRITVKPVQSILHKQDRIIDALYGVDARPRDGLDAQPGLIERQKNVERQIQVNGTGVALGDAVAEALKASRSNAEAIGRIEVAATTAAELAATAAEAVEQVRLKTAQDFEAAQDERSDIAHRLEPLEAWVEADRLRAETYRSALHELHHIDAAPREETP